MRVRRNGLRRNGLRRRAGATAVVGALLLVAAAAGSASASTGPAPGGDRAAAVQTVLDRVLGPGNSTVVVSATVRSSASATTRVQWGSAVPVVAAMSRAVVPGVGATTVRAAQNAVGGTTTTVATPPGALVRQTVSVAVDRAHLGRTSVAALRRLAASAAGLVPGRGDRLSLVVATFARPAVVAAPRPSLLAALLPDAVPALWGAGGLLALLVLAGAARGRRVRVRA